MNDSIKQLLNVQSRDLEIYRLQTEAAAIPAKINSLKVAIQNNKKALEDSKKDVIQFQLAKKQKDLDLEAREAAIRKHSNELNAVKTNEAYRALMGEIDKAKKERSELEDIVLQLMDQIDQAGRIWKEREQSAKGIEDGLQRQIGDLENAKKDLESKAEALRLERETLAEALPKPLATQYQRLHVHNPRGAAVVPIRNQQCGGCHMQVSQNLLNELRRGQKLLSCEACSRIVYLEEAPSEAQPAQADS